MPTTSAKPVTTPIPVQLSASEFQQFLFPHLTMPQRGPKCILGSHRVFTLIVWVLYTGMPWKSLPVPTDHDGKGFCRKVRFLGQNPKIACQEFNGLQTSKPSKKQLCDRTFFPIPSRR